jgi:type II secretory pathway pseudopilin PulG
MKKVGFTLFELTIVILIVSILCGIGISKLSFLSRVAAKAELEKMYALFMLLQNTAISTGKPEIVTFQPAASTYTHAIFTEKLLPGVQFGTIEGVLGPPATPTSPLKTPITFANNRLTFYPTGSRSAGSLYITDKQKNSLYALTCPIAGPMRMYKFHGKWMPLS